jgi:metallo-beta-lactamase class B
MISQDMVLADGETFELGGNSFELIETQGHTWGTASYSYHVKEGDDTFRAVTIGGLGLNAIKSAEQVEAYIESVDRLKGMGEAAEGGVSVHLTIHGFSNNLEEDRLKLASRAADEPHALVNREGILAQVSALRNRAEKRLERERNK